VSLSGRYHYLRPAERECHENCDDAVTGRTTQLRLTCSLPFSLGRMRRRTPAGLLPVDTLSVSGTGILGVIPRNRRTHGNLAMGPLGRPIKIRSGNELTL
jgi:hypothetical protein